MDHNSRKRPRSCEEDLCELMPISKRINDLHIRSGCGESQANFANLTAMIPGPSSPSEQMNNMYMTELQRQCIVNKELASMCSYNPELSSVQNPYYYHVNGVLYEAHMQRMQRTEKQMG